MFDENFKDMGFFYGPTFGEITIFSDNCAVQNKNNMTSWYMIWISETELFYHATIFIIF